MEQQQPLFNGFRLEIRGKTGFKIRCVAICHGCKNLSSKIDPVA